MKFYIKRDKTAGDHLFVVLNEQGRDKYFVTGTKNSSVISDNRGNSLVKIHRLPLPALKAFSISSGNYNIKFFINTSSKTPSCYFFGNSWLIRGDIDLNSFDIIDSDNSLVASHRKNFTAEKGYELCVNNDSNTLFCIAVAVCADIEAKVDNPSLQTV
jgi:uncharacterized protein YxjI